MDKCSEYRDKIMNNIECIAEDLDVLERNIIAIRRHIAMNNAFFRYHQVALIQDPNYGSREDLVELFMDTRAILGRIQKAKLQTEGLCRNLHYFDYKSCILFDETDHWIGKHL